MKKSRRGALKSSEKFIVSCLTRGGVAKEFNETIEESQELLRMGRALAHDRALAKVAKVAKFAPDDPRLTGRICQSLADAYNTLDNDDADDDADEMAGVKYELILKAAQAPQWRR